MRNIAVPPYVTMNADRETGNSDGLITRGKSARQPTRTSGRTIRAMHGRTSAVIGGLGNARTLTGLLLPRRSVCTQAKPATGGRFGRIGEWGATVQPVLVRAAGLKTRYTRKKPKGRMKIYNCFLRNTQNGMRLGGNTEVNNTVSIKNDEHPRQAWSDGSFQRGVNSEANGAGESVAGVEQLRRDAHRRQQRLLYTAISRPSCGGPITAPIPAERVDLSNVRISYDSTKNHDAIYTYAGEMNDGTPGEPQIPSSPKRQVPTTTSNEYGIFIGLEPDSWGTVSGAIGGSGPRRTPRTSATDDHQGEPDPTNHEPGAPESPPVGEVPMQSAQVVRIDNTGNGSVIDLRHQRRRVRRSRRGRRRDGEHGMGDVRCRQSVSPNSTRGDGTIPAGEEYVFYVTGGIESTSGSGPATWTVDGRAVHVPGDVNS